MSDKHQMFEQKLTKALNILRRTDIGESNYSPLMYKIYWKMGFCIAPPQFLPFWANILISGVPLGLSAAGFYIAANSDSEPSLIATIAITALTTAGWGLIIAIYYKAGKVRHHLPDWNSI